MASEEFVKRVAGAKRYAKRNPGDGYIVDVLLTCQQVAFTTENDIKYGLDIGNFTKKYLIDMIREKSKGATFGQLEEYAQRTKQSFPVIDKYYEVLRNEAYYSLDSFKLYIEKDRPRKERFYEPRRGTLLRITEAVQRLEEDKLDILFVHQPPRTGKSGDLTMDTAWHIGRDGEHSNLYVTYKEGLGGAFLTGVSEVMTDPTYCYGDIFPNVKIVDTDAKNNKMDLGRKKKYKTLSGKGLESGLNGEYDAYGWMIVDDPLEGVQDVMSEDVLKRKQTIFDNNVLSRKKENCKLIMMGTIWSVRDIFMNYLDFIQTSPEMEDVRYEIIKIPALDPQTDESNFNYEYGVGFTTKYYRSVRAKFEINDDMVGWQCQYMQEPIEREGAVFNPEHMRYYKNLPGGEPVKVLAHCDSALGGGDYVSFPVVYYFDNGDGTLSGYCVDVVFDNSEKTVTEPQVAAKIKLHRIHNVHFESNQGGESYAEDVRDMVKADKNYKEVLNVYTDWAPTTMRKDQRIWDNAQAIRELYFLEPELRDAQYRKFMQNLFSFTMGKNKHKNDDAADSLSGLIDFERKGSGVSKARIIKSPI